MKALVADGQGGVELAEIEPPRPAPGEAVIAVSASSINRVDARALAGADADPTHVAGGFDVAGTVVTAAADGSGPPQGARVVGYPAAGGWAEQAAVATESLAEIPAGLGDVEAAVLPTVGLTALRALSFGGLLLGRDVLVTGATGGVGMAAVQLASAAGANVTAMVRRADRAAAFEDVDVVVGPQLGSRRFDLVLDGVGSEILTAALSAVSPGGTVVSYGRSAWDGQDAPAAEVSSTWFGASMGARLVAMVVVDELRRQGSCSRDLSVLADLALTGTLAIPIEHEVSWEKCTEMMNLMRDTGVIGKISLRISN